MTSPTAEQILAPGEAERDPARPSSSRTAVAALRRSDLLCAAGRPDEALAAVMRPLGRPPRDPDLLTRLRIARGTASWLSGPPGAARGHIDKALRRAADGLTRARALTARARVQVADQLWDEARILLDEAAALYRDAGHPGLVEAVQLRAQAERDAGALSTAIAIQGEAVAAAERADDLHRRADARIFRAALFTLASRLPAARADLDACAADHAPAPLRARWGCALAMLELTEGDLPAARLALVESQAALAEGVDPRTRGDVLLAVSDLYLAEGQHEAAAEEASAALAEFRAVGDGSGESRSRLRRSHALLGAGRSAEALREGRRALKAAGRCPELQARAFLSIGRIHFTRTEVAEAREAFARAQALAPQDSSVYPASRIGHAVASGGNAESPEVQAGLRTLEERGDRRILSYCLADLQRRFGPDALAAAVDARPLTPDPDVASLVAAAEAMAGPEALPQRVAAALDALRPALPWWRAAVVNRVGGWWLRADGAPCAPLRADELPARLAERGSGPAVIDLAACEVWRRHPECALHGLAYAALVPVGVGRTLYVDVRDAVVEPGGRQIDLLTQLARLLAPHLVEPALAGEEDVLPELPGIVGRSGPMESLVREVVRVAAGPETVHIFGETGTGKERIAHAIHARSPRVAGPWVPVNASSLSDELFESEMFGHVRGAFSGAVADRRGFVSEAEGGTLFLDEVTDLSPKAQAKLLRFVQDREYRRVGDPRLQRANVRLVTAANVSLQECVRRGAFREDLMYRLCQETVVLPPLRDRGDDVLLLARHFLREGARGPLPRVAPAVWGLLAGHHWPGNVRELQSEIARARARAEGATLRPEHLSPSLQRPSRAPLRPLRQAVAEFEREHIARALLQHDGNRARTAAHLGLSRQALLAKINRLGIAPGLPSPARRAAPARPDY